MADVNVQLSITHTHDEHLDVFLIDPEGRRTELFTGVGGSDDHFENTILDDEARYPITRARPPFRGRYQPEAVAKEQPSLRRYRGESIEGVWILMIRAERSDRAGALNAWSLITTPFGEEGGSNDRAADDRRPSRGDYGRASGEDRRPEGPAAESFRSRFGPPSGRSFGPAGGSRWPSRSRPD